MALSAIVPLPASVAQNRACAFHPLAGHAPLPRIVRALRAGLPEPRRVVIAVDESVLAEARQSLGAENFSDVDVIAAPGPASRADCLAAALRLLSDTGAPSHVLVHDIAQPLISDAVLRRVIARLQTGVSLVVPVLDVTDSVKAVDAQGSVIATVDRSTLRAAQYPRGFAVDRLADLLARYGADEFDEIADALATGQAITVVDGDPDGFRVDLPRDVRFVEAIIASR